MIKKITFQAISIIFLAASFYFYEFIAQVAPSMIQHNLMSDFAINATQFGLISGFFYASYAPLQLLSGLLLDRYSARIILTSICLVFAIGVLIFAHAGNMYIAIIARILMGAAASCAFISVLHLINRWVPTTKFALFAGIAEMMGAIGGFSGSWLLTLLLKHFDWRTTMSWLAYAGFILAILIALIIRNTPKANNISNTKIQINNNSIWFDLKIIIRNRETWLIGFYSFFIWAPVLGFLFFGKEFLRINYNIENAAAAQAIAFAWIGLAIASPIIGWTSDFIDRRCIMMTICAIIGTVALLGIIFSTNLSLGILCILMFAIGFASAGQVLSFALIKDNNPLHTNGAANGFNNMILVSSGLIVQSLIGIVLDWCWHGTRHNGIRMYDLHGYQVAFSMLIACYFLAMLISNFFIKETRVKLKESI